MLPRYPTQPTKGNTIYMKKKFNVLSGARLATAVVVSSGALAAGSLALTASTAQADPTSSVDAAPLVGVGSNTVQDLLDGFSGAAPTPGNFESQATRYYTPLHDPVTSGSAPLGLGTFAQLEYYDALDPAVSPDSPSANGQPITTKLGGDSFARPDGSGDGVDALSDAIDGVKWSKKTGGAPAASVTGQIDFAASSSAPTEAAGTGLTWIDFAHDAVSYAYDPNSHVTNLSTVTQDITTAELTTSYSSALTSAGYATVDGVVIVPTVLQTSSGTWKFFVGKIGSPTNDTTAGPTALTGLDENDGNIFAANAQAGITQFLADKGLAATTPALAIEPFSVGSWISQANQTGLDISANARSAAVDLGNLDGTAGSGLKPYGGTPGSETPNTAYYGGNYGRDLYIVVPYLALNGPGSTSNGVDQSLFGYYGVNAPGSTSGLTSATTTQGVLESSAAQSQLGTFGFTAPTIHPLGTEFDTVTNDGQGS